MIGDVYDRHTDTVARTVWEAIRAWRAGCGRCDMLPWIDAPNSEKAGVTMTVSQLLARIGNEESIDFPAIPSTEEILAVNITYALAKERENATRE